MVICNYGITIDYDDGSMLDYNIETERLFPNQIKLSEEDLKRLFLFLEECDRLKPTFYDSEKMKKIYRAYNEQKNDD